MVKVKFQPLHSMASSIAHDDCRQEANTLSSLCIDVKKKKMGVTSLGRHTCPGCNLGHCRDLFFVLNDVDLHTVCFLLTSGDGLGLNCACVPLVPRLYSRCVH